MRVNQAAEVGSVRLTTEKQEIYSLLRQDPIWTAYAIGDLEPEHFPWCQWFLADGNDDPEALLLVYRRLDPPILLTAGAASLVERIFREAMLPRRIYMSARDEHLSSLEARYDFSGDRLRPMLRMAATPGSFCPDAAHRFNNGDHLRLLTAADLPAIEALYRLGGDYTPDAFAPAQVSEGIFYGVETDSGQLIAVAGTHLVARTWGVAAVGNIYTDPAQRGRGYGSLVTSAVTSDLLAGGLQVVLNVDQANAAAIHIYRKLGYEVHCSFYEGIGERRAGA